MLISQAVVRLGKADIDKRGKRTGLVSLSHILNLVLPQIVSLVESAHSFDHVVFEIATSREFFWRWQ